MMKLHNMVAEVRVTRTAIIKMSMGTLKKVFKKIIPTDWSKSVIATLGRKPQLPQFLDLPSAAILSSKGVKRVGHLFRDGKFSDLRSEYTIPPNRLFLYFQLRYAAASPFPALTMDQVDLDLEHLLSLEGTSNLISSHYLALMQNISGGCSFIWGKWEMNMPEISLGRSGRILDDYGDIIQGYINTT